MDAMVPGRPLYSADRRGVAFERQKNTHRIQPVRSSGGFMTHATHPADGLNRVRASIRLVLAAAACIVGAAPALAQEARPADSDELESVIVTGSRLQQTG